MINTSAPTPAKWYQTIWGVLIIGLVGLFLAALGIFLFMAGKYWYEIKQGRGQEIYKQIYGNTDSGDRDFAVITDRPMLGSDNAPVTIVEFVDFKCPNCLLVEPILKQVLQKYGSKVRLVVRNFPIESLHPGANQLAEMARCAYEQKQYWAMHDWLFANQADMTGTLKIAEVQAIASVIGLDVNKLMTCLSGTVAKTSVNRDYVDGYNLGINGTPAFFINGTKIEGVIPFAVWEQYLSNIE